MRTAIINIGNELLIGQVVNTNASWMAEKLTYAGFPADRIAIVADLREDILGILGECSEKFDLVLVTGGLGPTKDDITKATICEFFETRLVLNEEALRDIEELFARRGFTMTDPNRKQAELPETCISIPNTMGSARGMWFEGTSGNRSGTVFIFLPAVPFEMKEMMTREIIPRLRKRFTAEAIFSRTILTQGIGESFLSDQLETWENTLPPHITLAYLPQPGIVRLRLTGRGTAPDTVREEVEKEAEKLKSLIPEYIFGHDEETLEEIVGNLLRKKGLTLAMAESCTGGYIAHLITSIPGSSDYFKGSVVSYSDDIKKEILGVSPEHIRDYGAVSEEVVLEMARGIQEHFHADAAIATSGIAGPAGGTPEKPVGTTWIAVAVKDRVIARKYLFGDNRERNIRRTALQTLNMLRRELQ